MTHRTTTACQPPHRTHALASAIRACLGSNSTRHTASAAGLALLLACPLPTLAADFTVANHNDSGPGSLRQAVLDANATPGPDTVRFDSSVTGSILLTSGALTVTDPLTLEGPGQDHLTIDGGAVSTIFQVEDSLTIASLKLANAGGSAVNIAPRLAATTITIRDSRIAGSAASGIAVLGDYDDTTFNPLVLNVENSIITSNAGDGLATDDSLWSTIDLSVQVSGSTISGNGGTGLAMFGYGGPVMRIEDCVITDNGGAGIVVYGGHLEVKQSRVSGNTFDGIVAPSGEKPWYDPQSSAAVEHSVIADNGGDGVFGSDLALCDNTIANNRGTGIVSAASYYGGGETTIAGSTITGNQSGGVLQKGETGSALYFLQITNTTISDNHSPGNGAGIAISTRNWLPPPDAFLISTSTITGNTAEGSGGGIAFFGDNDSSFPVATVTNSIVAGNRASANPDLSTSSPFAVDYSLIQDPGNALLIETTPGANLFGLDPLLGALADNGGLTQTHGLLPGSPALDRGAPAFAPPPAFDQRGEGFDRVVDGRIDIGAVEAQADEAPSWRAWLTALGDTNGDGTPEIAVVSRVAGTNQAAVKDAATGALISRFTFNAALRPLVAVATMPALTQGGAPSLALLGAVPAQAETRAALLGDLVGSVIFRPGARTADRPVDLGVLADQDGNGVADLAMLVTASTRFIAPQKLTERVGIVPDEAPRVGTQREPWFGPPAISADGRFVAFTSRSSQHVPGDTNGNVDVFVQERATGATERVSLDSNGTQSNSVSSRPVISADGRFVAFQSDAGNLVPGDTNGKTDVFVHDRATGTTERVSLDSNGNQVNGYSTAPAISADGRFVAFESDAHRLVSGDTNPQDVFVRDRATGTTERVSLDSNGNQGNSYSLASAISADGRFVAFLSDASNLVPGDTNRRRDVFVHDRATGTTERVSVDSNGAQSADRSLGLAISADGRFVAFESAANNLVPGDTNYASDILVHDRETGTTERVSLDSNGNQGNRDNWRPAISADGRLVAFTSESSLVPDDTNATQDVFIRDRALGTTERVSIATCGTDVSRGSSGAPSISADGTAVAFWSNSINLVANDTNRRDDLFVRATNTAASPALCPIAEESTAVEIRDAATGTLFNTLSFAAQLDPRQVLALPDLNGNGSAEVGVSLLSTPGKADRVVIKDTATGALVQTLWSGAGLVQAAVVPDRNGNGAPEFALLWRNPAAGATQVRVVDAATGRLLAALAGFNQDFTPIKLAVIADVTGNGIEDYAVLGRKPDTGQVSATIQDGATGQWVSRIWYNKECTPLDLASIADLNGNGAPELVMLGRCGPDGQLRAVINDTKSGQVLRRLSF